MNCDHTGPREVEGVGEFPHEGLWNAATHHHVICTYASGVQLFIGDKTHYAGGVRWIGTEGWVHASRDKGLITSPANLVSAKLGPEETHLDKSLVNRQGHIRNFLDCIRTRAKTIAPIEVAHRTITVAHLGNIAMLLGRKIRWNPETEQIADDDTATRMLSRPYRGHWSTELSV